MGTHSGLVVKSEVAAREVMRNCLFKSGLEGWELKGGRYYRTMSLQENPEMAQLISLIRSGVTQALEDLGLNTSSVFKFESGTISTIEVSIEQAAFEEKIKPKLGQNDAGSLGSNVVVFQQRRR